MGVGMSNQNPIDANCRSRQQSIHEDFLHSYQCLCAVSGVSDGSVVC